MTLDTQLRTPEGLRSAALEWFDVAVDTDDAARWSAKYNKTMPSRYDTSAGPLMWLKNRMLERQLFSWGGAPDYLTLDGVDLHIAFLFIEETEEMLCRLRKPERTTTPDESVARSKIGKTAEIIQPIDATAAAVTDWNYTEVSQEARKQSETPPPRI
jgi:hypothetical protein